MGPFKSREERVKALQARGFDFLDQWEPEKALAVADKLAELRNSAAFEIAARAYWMNDEREEAIRKLEVGVKICPTVHILWSYLGQYYSDLERYPEAIAAFEAHRKCPGATDSMSDYNIALVLFRKGDYAEALSVLDRVKGEPPPPWTIKELRGIVLLDMGRYEQALELLLEVADERPKFTDPEPLAVMLGAMAEAQLELGKVDDALENAWGTIKLDKTNIRATRVIRVVRNQYSPAAKLWRVQASGIWRKPTSDGFFATYWVVAEDEQQAFDFAREFEWEEVRPSMTLTKAVAEEAMPEEPIGVYRAHGGYTFYTASGS